MATPDLEVLDRISPPARPVSPPHPIPSSPSRRRSTTRAASLEYFSPFCYSARGESLTAERSRGLRLLIKSRNPRILDLCIERLVAMLHTGLTPSFLSIQSLALVPIPRRVPTVRALSTNSAPAAIAHRLLGAGIGVHFWPALIRRTAIAKSAWARPGSRPAFAEHHDSLEILDHSPPTRQILLVDDIITRGRTLLSAAVLLRDEIPRIDVFGFALIRTDGLATDIAQITSPVTGVIRLLGGDAFRSP